MSRQGISILSLSIVVPNAVAACRAVSLAGTYTATDVFGITARPAFAGECVAVDVEGSVAVESGAAIAAGTKYVIADAQGRAIAGGTASACLGMLMPNQSAFAAGEHVQILLRISI